MIRTKPQIINITLRLKSTAYNTAHAYVHLPGAPFAFKYAEVDSLNPAIYCRHALYRPKRYTKIFYISKHTLIPHINNPVSVTNISMPVCFQIWASILILMHYCARWVEH